jgi:hypothetical protein
VCVFEHVQWRFVLNDRIARGYKVHMVFMNHLDAGYAIHLYQVAVGVKVI